MSHESPDIFVSTGSVEITGWAMIGFSFGVPSAVSALRSRPHPPSTKFVWSDVSETVFIDRTVRSQLFTKVWLHNGFYLELDRRYIRFTPTKR